MMIHPRDMELSALTYWIRQGLVDCFAIDFLSDRAQDSIVRFLAVELQAFYVRVQDKDYDPWSHREHPFFEKATLRHPLGAIFGDTLAKAVDASLQPVFQDLERGRQPKGTI